MSTVWGWYVTFEQSGEPTKFYAPNRYSWRYKFSECQASSKEVAESLALLIAAKRPEWIGKIRLRRMKPAHPWDSQPFYKGPLTKGPQDDP